MKTPDMSTTWLGLELSSPLVAASCPLTGDLGALKKLEYAGAGAVVLPSLFQEQVEHEELELGRLREVGADSVHEVSGFFPELTVYNTGPEGYLRLVEAARASLAIPVVASLNGISREGWARHARRIEAAGASAIELNLHYVPTDPEMGAEEVERIYIDQVAAVRGAVAIPISTKLGPHASAPANLALRLAEAGSDGIAIFNRFLEPDFDLESMEVVPRLELSRPSEMRLPLRWIAILSAKTELSLASTTGVHTPEDAVKLILAGADVVTVASALMVHGPFHLQTLLVGMKSWLEQHDYESVRQMRGSMNHRNCPDPRGFERLNYMKALTSFTRGAT